MYSEIHKVKTQSADNYMIRFLLFHFTPINSIEKYKNCNQFNT